MPSPPPTQAAWPPRFRRPQLRYATLIVPRTGRRVRSPDALHTIFDSPDDQTPLLPRSSLPSRNTENTWLNRAKAVKASAFAFFASETGKGVLKCSLAYLLGTLATFVPPIAALLGQQGGKHTVATITVYFHPARTMGSMLFALVCASVAFIYASLISVMSMGVSVFFEDAVHLLPLGHAIVLLVFCGGGLGLVGWVKQKMGDPLVNVGCSLASLAIVTVLTKEGAVQRGDISFVKISQVLKMLLMGTLATGAVCFAVYPVSARTKLRQALIEATDSLSDMLRIITETFLEGSEDLLEQKEFLEASERNKTASANIDKLLKEAKFEHYVMGTANEYYLEKKLSMCIQDLAQNTGGLRSAAELQFGLLKQSYVPNRSTSSSEGNLESQNEEAFPSIFSPVSTIREQVTPSEYFMESSDNGPQSHGLSLQASPMESSENIEPNSPADIFEKFIFHLGPSMRSLAYTLREILGELPYGPAPAFKIAINNKFRISLDRALGLYRTSRNDALNIIYMRKDFIKVRSAEVQADLEEVAASCGHFSFSLQEFAEELKDFLDILDELQLETEERPGGRSWAWLNPWSSHRRINGDDSISNPDVSVPSMNPKLLGTVTSSTLKAKGSLRFRLWKGLTIFRRDETKFAIKVGAGAALYALPSFLHSTRPIYSHWRGEWGLLSYMFVCSMTIGASNTTGYARFFGTCLGAFCALAAWYVTRANVFGLLFLGWTMSAWTAYIIIGQGRGPMGRFIMLTYNLVVLYSYSLSLKDSDDGQDEGGASPLVADIALHRVVAVSSGIVWGIFITRVIWPISARRKLKDGLSLLWLRMSIIWKRDPLSTMTRDGSANAYYTTKEKLELQRFLAHLETLRISANSEFSLKRPFPDASYRACLSGTRRMLDAFQAMNLEIMKNLTASEGEAAMLRHTLADRRQLSARITHLLAILASSMKLGYQLNDTPPDIDHSRDRLLARLHHFRKDQTTSRLTTDEDYALLYAFVLVTGQLRDEIMAVIDEPRRPASTSAMQINPAALTGTDSASTSVPAVKPAISAPTATQKTTKALISVPRLDFEPIYTELKIAVGDNWVAYKQATTLFLLGHLNQNEFSRRVDHFLCADPKLEHLHNNFICAIIGNLTRDLPDHGVASWVSANDKPTVVSKPASGDAAEQRLKTEVMQLQPRDRRRLKAIPEPDPHAIPNPLEEYHLAKQIRITDQVPANAGGLNTPNWELEIRKRYAQPLASEIGEFPDAESIHARMVPICYEESVTNGASFPCAVFMSIATENFIKEFLSHVFAQTRANGPSGTINGTMTRKYRQQLEKEELAFSRGELVKNSANGLLPVEAKEASTRQALGVQDLKFTLDLNGNLLGHMPLIVNQIMNGYLDGELEAEHEGYLELEDGTQEDPFEPDEMDIDEAGWDWQGATAADREQLNSLLDECLSMAA
ncbi:conserved hypothetical protein [Uncinocarpus reesii 1704]|uniref:Integral membrane bound transporter domain-containing protein n=1 Tax=Uncinocarpus reesii (strain UAMH 1704) TaxID=336963 RepID=C4JF32_UNCRE|nr:uncharacterized protein UREG_00933 [Uncinocarpus reesii 1704]EEP76085.1 conserved hypothetical protein [Uncinocarpus reesii 1704]